MQNEKFSISKEHVSNVNLYSTCANANIDAIGLIDTNEQNFAITKS